MKKNSVFESRPRISNFPRCKIIKQSLLNFARLFLCLRYISDIFLTRSEKSSIKFDVSRLSVMYICVLVSFFWVGLRHLYLCHPLETSRHSPWWNKTYSERPSKNSEIKFKQLLRTFTVFFLMYLLYMRGGGVHRSFVMKQITPINERSLRIASCR